MATQAHMDTAHTEDTAHLTTQAHTATADTAGKFS